MKTLKNLNFGLGWKKISATKKVAVLVLLVLSLFFGFVFSIQSVFFGKIYTVQRENLLKSAIKNLYDIYPDFESPDKIQQYLNELSNESSSNIMILNPEKEVIYSLSYSMTVENSEGDAVKIILDEITRDKNFNSLKLDKGDYVTVEYMYFDDERSNAYFPIKIQSKFGELTTRHPGPPENRRFLKTISGKIQSLTLPFKNNNFGRVNVMSVLFSWVNDEEAMISLEENGEFYGMVNSPDVNSKYAIFAVKTQNSDILFGAAPLNSPKESIKILSRVTMPWLILSVILSLVVAMIFSKQITKPIRSISRVTTKMKNLDFSEKCVLKSEDELGMLAENINDMSQKLDITIKQLVEANEKLKADIEKDKAAEQQRRDFVAAVSHELKTPLAIIRAYTEGLADGVSPKNSRRYMEVIINETEKMDSLILSMLENSRLESGAERLVVKNHDINGLVLKVCRVFEGSAGFENIHVKYEVGENAIMCDFDIDKIEQVINNFMSNAIKHTPKNGVIYVEVKEDGDYCIVSFENEGEHIRENELERVWDKFYKSDKSRDRSDGSTGLGLSIAKNILKLHSACYSVENTERGVKFKFTLKKNIHPQTKD